MEMPKPQYIWAGAGAPTESRLGVVNKAATLVHEGEDLGTQGSEGHGAVGLVAGRRL
jgi:hypothetical protein